MDKIEIRSYKHLRELLRLEKEHLIIITIYGIAVGLLNLTVPVAVQALVSNISFGVFIQPIIVLSLILLVGLMFAAVLRTLQGVVIEMIQRRLLVRFVDDLSNRLPKLADDALDGRDGREVMNRLFDVFLAQKAISKLLISGLEIALVVLVGIVVLAVYHPYLALFDFVVIILPIGIFYLLGGGGVKTAVMESKTKYRLLWYVQGLGGTPIPELRQMGPEIKKELNNHADDYMAKRRAHFKVVFRQMLFGFVMFALANAALLGVGGWLVIQGALTLGQLVAAELIVTAVVTSMAKTGNLLETYYDMMASLDKVAQVLDLKTIEPEPKVEVVEEEE